MTKQLNFILPKDAIGRFAIVKLWPDIKAAEDECIARIRSAAELLGIECLEVTADGTFCDGSLPGKVDRGNVDFVIHLHYDTPKQYDAFSFVALWNPIAFYHQWGYVRTSRNLTSHDDFISCSSVAADDHVRRLIRGHHTHLPPQFRLYHSTPDIVEPPSLGDEKIVYVGINWDALSGGISRHQDVLRRLDGTGQLRIFGPELFQGVRVWKGYKSYVREIPFDGISIIREISKGGVALVLSSKAHKESALMSSRLFESIAAGALIICDENPFAKKFFGDSLLYVDGRASAETITSVILAHLDWAKRNPELALQKIRRAQEIFVGSFTLTKSLAELYMGLADRKTRLSAKQTPPEVPMRIRAVFLIPEFTAELLQQHLKSIHSQTYRDFEPVIVVDVNEFALVQASLASIIVDGSKRPQVSTTNFFESSATANIRNRRALGLVLSEIVASSREFDALVIVAPNESLFSNHLSVLAGALKRDETIKCAATAAALMNSEHARSVHDLIDFGGINPLGPPGYGRFIIRTEAIPADIDIALSHLDGRPMAVIIGESEISQQLPVTLTINLRGALPIKLSDEAIENEVIREFSPGAFRIFAGFHSHRLISDGLPELRDRLRPRQIAFRKLADPAFLAYQIRRIRKEGFRSRVKTILTRLRSE